MAGIRVESPDLHSSHAAQVKPYSQWIISPLSDLKVILHTTYGIWLSEGLPTSQVMKPWNARVGMAVSSLQGETWPMGRRRGKRDGQINPLSLSHSVDYALMSFLFQMFWKGIHMLCEHICHRIHSLSVACCDVRASRVMNDIVLLPIFPCFTSLFPFSHWCRFVLSK